MINYKNLVEVVLVLLVILCITLSSHEACAKNKKPSLNWGDHIHSLLEEDLWNEDDIHDVYFIFSVPMFHAFIPSQNDHKTIEKFRLFFSK